MKHAFKLIGLAICAAAALELGAQQPDPFAKEKQILKDCELTQQTLKNDAGSLNYCQNLYNKNKSGKPAMLVFLHGIGERGEENLAQNRLAVPTIVKNIRDNKRKVVLLTVQCPSSQLWAPLHRGGGDSALRAKPFQACGMIPALVEAKVKEFGVDPDRVYITGLSMGSYGTWDVICRRPDLFAAAIPICGGADLKQAPVLKNMAISIFHGDADPLVPVDLSRKMYKALQDAGNKNVKYTEYPKVDHNSWDRTYANPDTFKWLFDQKRSKAGAQAKPLPAAEQPAQQPRQGGFGPGQGGFPGGPRPQGQRPQGQRPQGPRPPQAGVSGQGAAMMRPFPRNAFGPGQGPELQPLLKAGASQSEKDESVFKNTGVTAKSFNANGIKINYCEAAYNMNAPGKAAVVLFLHGGGERGSDNKSHLRYGFEQLIEYFRSHKNAKAVIVAPQCPGNEFWGTMFGETAAVKDDSVFARIPSLLEAKIAEYGADPDRIYVTGFSMGGHGTLEMAARNNKLFAAAAAICCGGTKEQSERLKDMPLRLFQGTADTTVRPEMTRDFVKMLKDAGNTKFAYKEYPLIGHGSWDQAFNDFATFDWLMAQKRPTPQAAAQAAAQREKDKALLKEFGLTQKRFQVNSTEINYCEGLYNQDAPGRNCVILYLHGGGERGNDNIAQARGMAEFLSYFKTRTNAKAVVIAPQCPANEVWGNMSGRNDADDPDSVFSCLPKLITAKMSEYNADPSRIYVTGFSMGGRGSLEMISRNVELFGAAVVSSSSGSEEEADMLKNVPIAIFHGSTDNVVPVERGRAFFKMLQDRGNKSATYKEYPNLGHGAWIPAYKDPATLDWLLSQHRSFSAPTLTPELQKAADLRVFRDCALTQNTFDAGVCKISYCQGVYNADAPGKPSVLVFMHGVGERGGDNMSQIRYGFEEIVKYLRTHLKEKTVVLAPQCPGTEHWGSNVQRGADGTIKPDSVFANIPNLVKAKIVEFGADPSRIYVTGFSMGGHGAVELAGRNSSLFAACVAICCGGTKTEAEWLKDMPIALYQGNYDDTVRTELTRDFFKMLQEAGNTKCSYREYPLIAHNALDVCYNDDETLNWLFSQRKGQ